MIIVTPEQKLERVYRRGMDAYYEGKKEEDNPHYHTTDGSHSKWREGWMDAKEEDKDFKDSKLHETY